MSIFLQSVTNYDVKFLGETWTNESSCYNINGFQNFAAHRKLQKTSARRSSGGVIAYIKNDILRGVSSLQGCTEEAVWLKFHKDFLKISNDITICLCYIAPMNSSSRVQTDTDSFDNIILDIARLKALHPNAVFMVCGDMNGRTGVSPDYVINDNSHYLPLPDDYIEDSEILRANEDHMVNTQGRSVLEVCKICDLRIVNGRNGLDKDIGRYTCCTHNGRSTVDYVLCSSVYLESIINFNVCDQNQFSDHNALELCILVNPSSISDKLPEITHKMIWNHQLVNDFVEALSSAEVNEMLENMVDKIDNNDNITTGVEVVDMFTNALRKTADPYFLKKFNNKKRPSNKGHPEWADEEWLRRKKLFFRSRDKHKSNPSITNRVNMISARKEFKSLSQKRQAEFEHRETRKLLNARVNNVKLFWRMFAGKQKDRLTYQISNNEFRDYFMKLSDPGDEFFQPNTDIRDKLNDWLSQELECAFMELNCDISEYEVKLAISQLKSGKSGCCSMNSLCMGKMCC